MKERNATMWAVGIAVLIVFGIYSSAAAEGPYKLLAKVETFLKSQGWQYDRANDRPLIRFGIRGKNASWQCYAQTREEQNQFLFFTVWPVRVPSDLRSSVGEYLARVNYRLVTGNFEIDYDEGEIRYKTTVDVCDGDLTQKMIERSIFINISTADKYLSGLTKVVYGRANPKAALEEVDKYLSGLMKVVYARTNPKAAIGEVER